jgi:DNA-binding HxlR family transcriptional regulator
MGIDQTTPHHPDRDEIELPAVLHALSDPHRLEIVRRLSEDSEPRACGAFGFDLAKSTLTHHFRVLRESGVIEQKREEPPSSPRSGARTSMGGSQACSTPCSPRSQSPLDPAGLTPGGD